MKLFIVRHGETEQNASGILTGQIDARLTEKGKTQAKEIALVLKEYTFSHIYSSDLVRCVDTATSIAEFHPEVPLTITEELRERHLGIFQGQHNTSVDWDSLVGDYDNRKPENGESVAELKTRALDFVAKLYQEHKDENILLVSHTGWMKQIISHFAGIPSKDVSKVENTQVIEVEVGEGLSGKVLNLNQ